MKAGNSCCELPLKTTEEDQKETGSDCEPAGVKEIIMDAAVASVLSELGGIFILKEEQIDE